MTGWSRPGMSAPRMKILRNRASVDVEEHQEAEREAVHLAKIESAAAALQVAIDPARPDVAIRQRRLVNRALLLRTARGQTRGRVRIRTPWWSHHVRSPTCR